MQAHARVCEENKGELEKKRTPIEAIETILWKGHMERVGKCIEIIFSRMIYHNIKVLLLYLVKY